MLFRLFCFILLFCAAAQAADRPPNVVLLSVDTLRADYLGCYGYAYPSSPRLDQFAEGAQVFTDAVCEVPLTAPSFGAMLTSRYPRMNGAQRNGLRIPDEVPLVAEVFQDAGYQTFCVQSNWTLKGRLSGMDRGFDRYDDDFEEKRWGVMLGERGGETVRNLALQYLSECDPERPLFAWIHFSDPHAPYEFDSDFNPWDEKPRRKSKTDKTRLKYASEVAFTDAQIAKVLDALPENTVVLFVADHGESLHEHDYLGHGRRIYQTNMHVPLMVRGPGVPVGRNDAPVRGIDVGPTLLGLAGLPKPEGMLGLDLLQDEIPAPRPRVVETYRGAVPRVPGLKAIMSDAGPMRQGVYLDGWKLIIGDRHPELFYLPDDPMETHDRADEDPERIAALTALIENWDQATEQGTATGDELSKEDIEALESLGYVE